MLELKITKSNVKNSRPIISSRLIQELTTS